MQLIRVVASCFMGAELLGWTSSALLGSSERDDAGLFLAISGFNHYWTAAICAAIGLLLTTVLMRTGRLFD
jgi:heme/copper-type cytochrome/quinol oxidase subunit 1